ncbi:MAG: EthD family reductase [Armatimonadota bacterium]|nr:EthD family reductase [Armatimonadota bacterium]MDR7451932.1 EthD family reductase [Armatimonadota bacterium]MDR7466614.1 EthD family reductase [Armatimonadota bacterium]MDR7492912.1 EthD family reductase [Armatimonadota bacterium]MDR7500309.1 EthD family reductase [Armatimonadota bacterium]
MVKLVALYRRPSDPAAFDRHYEQTHLPLVRKMPGLRRLEGWRITGAPGGDAPYYLVAEMFFDDAEAMRAALRSPEGRAAGEDLQRFAGGLVTLVYAQPL